MVARAVSYAIDVRSVAVSDSMKQYVWANARLAFMMDASWWRVDQAGRLMYWSAYGNRYSEYGWELGHIVAAADGGSDLWFNMQAENWQTNLQKEEARRKAEATRAFMAARSAGAMARSALLGENQPKTFGGMTIVDLLMNKAMFGDKR